MKRSALVVGAGALGTACARAFNARGWTVTLIDPAGPPSASAVAAGMLAPAFESMLDGADARRVALLRAAAGLWRRLLSNADQQTGAVWIGPDREIVLQTLLDAGFDARMTDLGVHTADDLLIDPLIWLQRAGNTTERVAIAASSVRPGRVEIGGENHLADAVVLATGVDPVHGPEAAPALAAVTPIRGQILTLAVPPPPAVLRMPGGYAVPANGRLRLGATMEPGSRSREPDAEQAQRMIAAAAQWWPSLAGTEPLSIDVGIRGATADGLPLAGLVAPGLSVALAPRRNGWLLAPLVAEVVLAGVLGEPHPYAAAFHPLRFQPS